MIVINKLQHSISKINIKISYFMCSIYLIRIQSSFVKFLFSFYGLITNKNKLCDCFYLKKITNITTICGKYYCHHRADVNVVTKCNNGKYSIVY